jgi:hypothetical protein
MTDWLILVELAQVDTDRAHAPKRFHGRLDAVLVAGGCALWRAVSERKRETALTPPRDHCGRRVAWAPNQ